jgi:translation initiation factor 5B
MELEQRLRQPIVVVLGHVDSGKTSLLDKIRGTAVQEREAGGITQEIGASFFPLETLKAICGPLLQRTGGELKVPGLLFIDTPGHEVFSNLRVRGGSAADIAIVVVDAMKGLENQTVESIDILKQRKVPFLIALNKIDMIKGWKKTESKFLFQTLKEQPDEWRDELELRLYNVATSVSLLGFKADAYYRVKDFRSYVSIVPVSARYGVGIPELLAVLIGLAQQFLAGRLRLIKNESARGIILELQEETGIGQTANIILTEGKLSLADSIAIITREGAIKSKVKALFMPKPLDEMRDPRDKFTPVKEVFAAAGVKLVCQGLEKAIAGTSILSFKTEEEFQRIKEEAQKELSEIVVRKENAGVVVKAGSVGGLEAILKMLEQRNIPVRVAEIGDVSRNDIVEAQVVSEHDPYLGAILAFDVKVLQDAKEQIASVPFFSSKVIYEVVDSYVEWQQKKREEDKKIALSSITPPCKMKVIPGTFFRRSDPAIFGVEIISGKIRPKVRIMDSSGKELGMLMQIQESGKSMDAASKGHKVAISINGPTLGRQIKEDDILYTSPKSHEVKTIKERFLSSLSEDELKALDEIVKIKSLSDPLFGL